MEEGQLGMSDKLHQIEAALSKLAESISASKGTSNFNNHESSGSAQHSQSEEGTDCNLFHGLLSLSAQSLQVATQQNGTTEYFNSSCTKSPPTSRRCLLLPFTSRERPTNGGNGCSVRIVRRTNW